MVRLPWASSLEQCPSHDLLGGDRWAGLGTTGVIISPSRSKSTLGSHKLEHVTEKRMSELLSLPCTCNTGQMDGSSAILHSCCIYSSLEKHNANNYYSSTVFTQKVNVSSLYFSPSGVLVLYI